MLGWRKDTGERLISLEAVPKQKWKTRSCKSKGKEGETVPQLAAAGGVNSHNYPETVNFKGNYRL